MISGEERAFSCLYERYYATIFRIALQYVKSPELAKDVCQEISIKIWEKRCQLSVVKDFGAYIKRVTRNHSIDVLRAAARSDVVFGEIARHFPNDIPVQDDSALSKDYQEFVRKTVERFPPRTREIFILCREEGKTYKEIAAQLAIAQDTVHKTMGIALNKLRNAVYSEYGYSVSVLLPVLCWLEQVYTCNW